MSKLRIKFTLFKNNLFKINDIEPLSKFVLVIIIILDIVLLNVIYIGLNEHTRQLTTVYEYMPDKCRDVFIKKNYNIINRQDKLQEIVLNYYDNYSYDYKKRFKTEKINKMYPLCKTFYQKVKLISEDKILKHLFLDLRKNKNKLYSIREKIKEYKIEYETSLLERIANNEKTKEIKKKFVEHKTKIKFVEVEITSVKKEINKNKLIKDLYTFLALKKDRSLIVQDLQSFEFWYELKETSWQLLFLLPIFIVFYFWNFLTLRNNNKLQLLISSHSLLIIAIPIIIEIIELPLSLIPKLFFKWLFKILEQLYLVGLWYYFVIVVFVVVGVFLIYFINQKMFNLQRTYQRRLTKGQCYYCSNKLPHNSTICPFCSKKQVRNCTNCQNDTYIVGNYCQNCGYKQLN